MFYRYEIKNNGKEDVLYLYLTMTYEFSKELGAKENHKEITKRTKNFIKNNSIDFKGDKVYLVIDGIVIKTIELKHEEEIEQLEMKNAEYGNDHLVTVKLDNKITTEITLKEYLLGILSTNAISNLELTTLKALCVLYRTYAYKMMKENQLIEASNPYQLYKPISYYKMIWLNDYQETYNKLEKAIRDTECQFVCYHDEYILPFIHITNNGKTESSKDYPYLDSRTSLWDYASPYYLEIKDYDYEDMSKILKIEKKKVKDISILDVKEKNHIERIKVGDNIFHGDEFRNLLGLRSTDINMIINPTFVRFITKGWGNNLGLSQFGANEIAKAGCSHIDIIKYYFPKVNIKKYI